MEVSEFVNRTKHNAPLKTYAEFPPNQDFESSSRSTLIGKLISSKNPNLTIVKDVVLKAWRLVYQLAVKRLDKDIYLFSFQHEADALKVFDRSPWFIHGGHLILKECNPNLSWQEVNFSKYTFWIQVHRLPSLWQSEPNLRNIRARAGTIYRS